MSSASPLRLVGGLASGGDATAVALGLVEPEASPAQRHYRTVVSALADPDLGSWLGARWDPHHAIYTFRRSDPHSICAVEGCSHVVRRQRLCHTCLPRFVASGALHSLEWAATQRIDRARSSKMPGPCGVVDKRGRRCERPSRGPSGLCNAHRVQRSNHPQGDLAAFGALDCVRAFDRPPLCSIEGCTWPSARTLPAGHHVCTSHTDMWRHRWRLGLDLRWEDWEPYQMPAGLEPWQLWLGGVCDELRAEVLYLLAYLRKRIQDVAVWREFLGEARAQASTRFAEVVRARSGRDGSIIHQTRVSALDLLQADPESEWDRDQVRLSVVRPGADGTTLGMGGITQPWLRTLTVDVMRADVLRLNGKTLFERVRAMARLSESLSTRADGGVAARAVRAADVAHFVRFLRAAGEDDQLIYGRLLKVRQVINRAHKLGVAGVLSPAFNVHQEHLPHLSHRQKVAGERAFPDATFKLLMGHDELLGERVFALLRSVPGRRGFRPELVGEVLEQVVRGAANFGRRPSELLAITADRVRRTDGGGGALRYDNLKSARTAVWLPIDSREIDRLLAYKAELRRHYTAMPESRLLLYPRTRHHDDGTIPLQRTSVSRFFRIWCTLLEAAIFVAKLAAALPVAVADILELQRCDVTAAGIRVRDHVHALPRPAQAALTDLVNEVSEHYGPDGPLFVGDPSPSGADTPLTLERLDALGAGWLEAAAGYPTWGLPGEHLGQERISQFQIEFRRFRHTYLQHLVDAGTDIFLVQELADHEDISTTINSYVRTRLEQLTEAVEQLSGYRLNRFGRAARDEMRIANLTDVVSNTCTNPQVHGFNKEGCDFGRQCPGCPHFAADPSHQPDIRAEIMTLRKSIQRFEDQGRSDRARIAREDLDAWQYVDRRIQELLDSLSEEERSRVDNAARVIRACRSHTRNGTVTIGVTVLSKDENLE